MPCDEGHRKAMHGKPHARFDEGGQAIVTMSGYSGTARRKGREQTDLIYHYKPKEIKSSRQKAALSPILRLQLFPFLRVIQ